MGQTTGIAWTRSTRNFWTGCTKVGPGCDGCYAEAHMRRLKGTNTVTGQAVMWGPHAPRVDNVAGAVRLITKWNKLAAWEARERPERAVDGSDWPRPGFWPVFINSYSDTFDNEVPARWRDTLFTLIEHSRHLTFQLVTKRAVNVPSMVPSDWMRDGFPPNVWLLATMVNDAELDRDMPKLLQVAPYLKVIGISSEPQIEPLDSLRPWLKEMNGIGVKKFWGIVGGESGQPDHPARAFDIDGAQRFIEDLQDYDYTPFMKQMGSRPVYANGRQVEGITGKGDDPDEWPERLRVQEFPL